MIGSSGVVSGGDEKGKGARQTLRWWSVGTPLPLVCSVSGAAIANSRSIWRNVRVSKEQMQSKKGVSYESNCSLLRYILMKHGLVVLNFE